MTTVSIAIPTYNQEAYVGEAITSCLRQSYPDIKIIVRDDCSTDGTARICRHYLGDSRVSYYLNERNVGRLENYRQLLDDGAGSTWHINLDGDDYFIDDDFIRRGVELLTSHPEAVFYQGNHDLERTIWNGLLQFSGSVLNSAIPKSLSGERTILRISQRSDTLPIVQRFMTAPERLT
jgi:glycosyltransferase involved in cell wall biosynthesis